MIAGEVEAPDNIDEPTERTIAGGVPVTTVCIWRIPHCEDFVRRIRAGVDPFHSDRRASRCGEASKRGIRAGIGPTSGCRVICQINDTIHNVDISGKVAVSGYNISKLRVGRCPRDITI